MLLAAQVGISGSTRVGAGATFAGQSGAAGHLEIAGGTVVAGKTAVFQSISEPAFVAGVPATDHRVWKRSSAATRKLPELLQRVRTGLRLEDKVEAGEYALEYLKRLSPRAMLYLGVEGSEDEVEVIPVLRWFLTPDLSLHLNSAFGATSKATDWAPEIGLMFRF